MIAKFLFNYAPSIPLGKEDIHGNVSFKNTLLMVRKDDTYQHSDMKRHCAFIPGNGGFVQFKNRPEEDYFYGESISCNVETDDSMVELYRPIIKEGEWYKCEYVNHNKIPFTLFCGVEKGYYPSSLMNDIKWVPVKYTEIPEIMKKESRI